MIRPFPRAATLGLLLFFLAALPNRPARGQWGPFRVQAELDGLHDWLGDDDNARRWRRFLQSDALQAQVVLGDEADAAVVNGIFDVYSSDVPGLSRRRFAAVRRALGRWRDELSALVDEDFSATARRIKTQYQPVGPAQLERARRTAYERANELARFLEGGGARKNQGWREFLKWDELERQLQSDDSPDPQTLASVARQFFSGVPGLELPPFARTRRSLVGYFEVLSLAQNEKAADAYANQLDTLAKHLEKYAEDPSPESASEIGLRLDWLEGLGRHTDFVDRVRRRLSRPNLFVGVSGELVVAGLGEAVSEPTEIRDTILGTRIVGSGVTSGQLTARIAPSAGRAAVDILMAATTTSDTVGTNGPVRILSDGVTRIRAKKRLFFDLEGVSPDRSSASCITSTRIRGISAGDRLGRRLIERIAWTRALESKPQAERIAARHAERRVEDRMDRRAEDMAADVNRRFAQRFRGPLVKAGVFPENVYVGSTRDQIVIAVQQAQSWQLAAPGVAPVPATKSELSVRVHQSLINNSAEILLGGMTVSDERLIQMLKERELEIPDELRIGPDKEPWSITFDHRWPVRVTFDEDSASIAIRGRSFRRGEQTLTETTEISARYKLSVGPTGAKLTRDGEVNVEFVDQPGRLGAKQIAFKTFLRRKFEAMFAEEFVSKGIKLPENLRRIGRVELSGLNAANGWLLAGWNRAARTAAVKSSSERN